MDTELDLLVTNLTAVNIGLDGGRTISLSAKRAQNFLDMVWETKSHRLKNEDGSNKKDADGNDLPKHVLHEVIVDEMTAFVKKETGADIDDWEAMAIWGYLEAPIHDSGKRDTDGNPILQTIIEKKRAGLLNQEAVAHVSPTSPPSSDLRFAE